tara:strand:- start:1772 stop:2227 length:456 start_codon:yes stop_codon:yes gene_type:complete
VKIRSNLALALISAMLFGAAGVGPQGLRLVDAAYAEPQKKGKALSVTRYYKLRPFTLPVLFKGEIEEHFTIVMALELANEDARQEVHRRIPRVRNEFYKALLSLVTFRRKGAPIPDIEVFKVRLLQVAQETYGRELVKNLLIQQAFKRAVR